MGNPSFGGDYNRVPLSHERVRGDTKSEGCTFIHDGEGVKLMNNAGNLGALGQCRVSTKDMRAQVDQFLREFALERLNECKADEAVRRELDRRIDIAVKSVLPRVEREVEVAVKAAIAERVKSIVAALNINVSVEVTSNG